MELTIFASYAEANEALGLPRSSGVLGDLTPIPALDPDVNPEQYTAVVYISPRGWP